MKDLDDIMATLNNYADAYCAKDIEALMRVFDVNCHISVIGTGEDELCSGAESVKQLFLRNFAEATAIRFEWGWSDTVISGDHAVVSQCLTIHVNAGGSFLSIPVRWSVMLKKTDRWVWLHRHASSAATSQGEGQAYPAR